MAGSRRKVRERERNAGCQKQQELARTTSWRRGGSTKAVPPANYGAAPARQQHYKHAPAPSNLPTLPLCLQQASLPSMLNGSLTFAPSLWRQGRPKRPERPSISGSLSESSTTFQLVFFWFGLAAWRLFLLIPTTTTAWETCCQSSPLLRGSSAQPSTGTCGSLGARPPTIAAIVNSCCCDTEQFAVREPRSQPPT